MAKLLIPQKLIKQNFSENSKMPTKDHLQRVSSNDRVKNDQTSMDSLNEEIKSDLPVNHIQN